MNSLARLLYDFLPGEAHSYARQDVSFSGIASSLGLQNFWIGGSKLPGVEHLITNTLLHQEKTFCPLIVTIVQKALVYRNTKKSPVTREEVEQLNQFVYDLGFKIPELWDPKFLGGLRGLHKTDNQKSEAQAAGAATDLSGLKERLLNLTGLTAQHRGFEFERFLNKVFTSFRLAPRSPFRIIGEQIDGSLQFQGETYLVEAKWQNLPTGEADLLTFAGKVAGKAKWSRGLFISYSGFSKDGLEAFARGKPTQIICMDGLDFHYVFEGTLEILERKARRAVETNEAFVSARELFTGLP